MNFNLFLLILISSYTNKSDIYWFSEPSSTFNSLQHTVLEPLLLPVQVSQDAVSNFFLALLRLTHQWAYIGAFVWVEFVSLVLHHPNKSPFGRSVIFIVFCFYLFGSESVELPLEVVGFFEIVFEVIVNADLSRRAHTLYIFLRISMSSTDSSSSRRISSSITWSA